MNAIEIENAIERAVEMTKIVYAQKSAGPVVAMLTLYNAFHHLRDILGREPTNREDAALVAAISAKVAAARKDRFEREQAARADKIARALARQP